ncbi:MAG: rod shape-determining protein MreC [Alphaproteobacteria bacterium]
MRRPRTSSRAIITRAPRILTAGTIFLIAGLLIASPFDLALISRIRMAMLDATSPVLQTIPISPINQLTNLVTSLRDTTRLWAVNAALKEENQKLTRWYGEAERLKSENRELRGLLALPTAEYPDRILAQVIGAASNSVSHSVFVRAGQNQNIKANHIASNETGIVGRVIEVGERTARVLLFTDISSRVPVYVGEDRHNAILAGNNEQQLSLVHFPEDAIARRGDIVFTSGSGGIFPPHIEIGVVQGKHNNDFIITPFSNAQANGFLFLSEPQRTTLE